MIGSAGGAPKADGVTVADIATWAEYGIGQPMRSWLRGWVDTNQGLIRSTTKKLFAGLTAGRTTEAQALALLGVWVVGQLQANIARGIQPANAPSTIRKKGSSTPLIATGQFRQSITSRVVDR